jgi:hypothetical protein
MPGKSYQEVLQGLKKEELDIPYDELPEEMGAFRDAPQPGSYRFKCPPSLDTCFDTLQMAVRDGEGNIIQKDGKNVTQERINVIFDRDYALVILQSPHGAVDGEPLNYRISNVERRRPAGKDVFVKVSDLTYLLKAVAPEARPKTNEEFIQVAMQTLPGLEFGADIEWQGSCNPERSAYFAFANEETGEVMYETAVAEGETEEKKGCGKRIYHRDWPKDPEKPGQYLTRATCECQASIRPFVQLVRFKA